MIIGLIVLWINSFTPKDNTSIELIKELNYYQDSVTKLIEVMKENSDSLDLKIKKDTIIVKKIYYEKKDSIINLPPNESIQLFSDYISEIELD